MRRYSKPEQMGRRHPYGTLTLVVGPHMATAGALTCGLQRRPVIVIEIILHQTFGAALQGEGRPVLSVGAGEGMLVCVSTGYVAFLCLQGTIAGLI